MDHVKSMSKGYVIINGNHFPVTFAINEDEQTRGLMSVEPPLTSMAFIYPIPQVNRFWMKNVKADLDILFCYKGQIIDVVRGSSMSTRLLGPDTFSDLVVEVPAEMSEKHDFASGDDVKLILSKEALNKILA